MARILIAEDEPDIRDLITFTLRYAGHEVIATANGEEAYLKAQEVNPDLIMMDVRMPKMTGYEACRKMKEIDTLKPVPVIFLSAKGQESEVQAGLEAGAVEYILKPFAPDQLSSRVNAILEKFSQPQAPQPPAQIPQQPSAQPSQPPAQTPQPPPQTAPHTPPAQRPQQPTPRPTQPPAQTPQQPPRTAPQTPPAQRPQQPSPQPYQPPAQTPQQPPQTAPHTPPAQQPQQPMPRPTEPPAQTPQQPPQTAPHTPPAQPQEPPVEDKPDSIWRRSYRRTDRQPDKADKSEPEQDQDENDSEKKRPRWPF